MTAIRLQLYILIKLNQSLKDINLLRALIMEFLISIAQKSLMSPHQH